MNKTIYLLCKMEKRMNFSDFEKQVLINLMKEPFSAVLKNKVTNAVVNRQKHEAWEHLTRLYNATPNVSRRNMKQLMNLHRNMKKKALFNLAEKKLERLRNIGNIPSIMPPPPPIIATVESGEILTGSTDDSSHQIEFPSIKLEEPEESQIYGELVIKSTTGAYEEPLTHSPPAKKKKPLPVSNTAINTLMESSDYEIKLQNEEHEHIMKQRQTKHEQLLQYREAEHEQMMKHRETEHEQLLKHKEADYEQLLKHRDAEYDQLLRHREAKYEQLLKHREAEYEQLLKHKNGEHKQLMKQRDQDKGMNKTEDKYDVSL